MNIRLEPCKKADYETLEAIYLTAFPKNERSPFSMLVKKAEKGKGDFLTVKDGGGIIGMAYTVCGGSAAYLFYLAIADDKRGRGCGTAVLSALKERYRGRKLFLARERLDEPCDNLEQRIKRRDFYLANGFSDQNGHIKEGRVTYDIMSIGGPVTADDYRQLMVQWSGRLFVRLMGIKITD